MRGARYDKPSHDPRKYENDSTLVLQSRSWQWNNKSMSRAEQKLDALDE